jgi:hypothetical protein
MEKTSHIKVTGCMQAQVYKANALVEASYRLSVYEQRIIARLHRPGQIVMSH